MIGQTTLKFGDYFFVYGSFFMLARIFDFEIIDDGFHIVNDHFIAVIFAGFISTGILAFDPGSKWIQKMFPYNEHCERADREYAVDKDDFKDNIIKALNINSIKHEKNKLIGFVYYLSSLVILAIFIVKILSDYESIIPIVFGILVFIIYAGAIKIIRDWKQFQNNVCNCAWYGIASNADCCFESTLNSLNNSIEQGDWSIVSSLSEKTQREYFKESGLEEQRKSQRSNHIKSLIHLFIKHIKHERKSGSLSIDTREYIKGFPKSEYLLCHIGLDSTKKEMWKKIVKLLEMDIKNDTKDEIYMLGSELFDDFEDIFAIYQTDDHSLAGFCNICVKDEMVNSMEYDNFSTSDIPDKINKLLQRS